MIKELIRSNWHEIELSHSAFDIQSIEYRNPENLKSFRDKYNNSTFLRFRDKVYIWGNIAFDRVVTQNIKKGVDDFLISKIISESMLNQFYSEPKLFITKSFGLIRITDYRVDISNNDFPYLNTYRSYNLTFSSLIINNELKYGFNITSGISHQITWGLEEFNDNDLSTDNLTILDNGKVRADSTAIYKISNLYGDSSKLKKSIEKLTEESIQITCCKAFVKEFFNPNKADFKLPGSCKIEKIVKSDFQKKSSVIHKSCFEKLEDPKYYFYRNATPPANTVKYAMRSKIKYNKPTTYDNFENKDITIGVVFPKEHHLKIATFTKAIQEELCTIYRIPKENFKYETFPIEDSNLKSYQEILQNAKDIDLAIVVVDEIHELLPIHESPYYFCKAEFIKRGINSQEVQIQQINKFIADHKSGFTNYADHTISLNIYAKLGGAAWTVKPKGEHRNELVIGVGATTDKEGIPQIGMTSVFRGDGKYLVGDVAAVTSVEDYNKHLYTVLTKNINNCLEAKILDSSKAVYLVFHLFKKPGYSNEIEALNSVIEGFKGIEFKYSFVYVGDGHNFRFNKYKKNTDQESTILVDLPRGTYINVNEVLSFIALRKNSSTCCKIEIDRRSNVINMEYLAKQVYDFSNLSHSSFNKQASPISIKYSKLMARMSSKLKLVDGFYMSQISMPDNSPWFL